MVKRETAVEGFEMKDPCPRCRHGRLKEWRDLGDEERMLVEKLPGSAVYAAAERKKHRFCMRCLFEDDGKTEQRA